MVSRDGVALPSVSDFLNGGGKMGAMMRSHVWPAVPIGRPEDWPQPLKTLVGVMLGSSQPMFVAWGPERTLLYNDAYSDILADKHPSALGRDLLEVWSEIRADLQPIVEAAYAGTPVQMDDITLVMLRKGFPEETHFSFSYTPVRDEAGSVAGFFCPCLEITEQVLSDRRRSFRIALEERLRDLADPSEIISAASEALGRHLNVAQVAYAEVDTAGETVLIEREWNSGAMASNVGRHRLADYGPAFADDLRRGQRIAIADVRLDPRTSSPEALAAFERISIASFVNIPLVKAGKLVAVLAVHHIEPRPWFANEIALAEDLGERIWAAVERARTEAHLQQTTNRLNALLANASVSIFLIDDEHRCQYMNPAAETLTGYTLSETEGHHLHDIIHHTRPDGSPYPSHECPIDGVSPGSGREQGEEVFVHKSGRFVPVAFSASSVCDETGKIVGTIVEAQDITERKAAETGLRESEARFRQFGEAASDALWIVDAETGRLEYLSPAFERIWGEPRERVMSDIARWADFLHPDDREAGLSGMPRLLAGERVTNEYRIVRADGDVRWILDVGFPITDEAGRVVRAGGIAQDLTERRLAEEALRESELRLRELNETLEQRVAERTAELSESQRRFQGIFDSALQFMALLSPDGIVVEVNQTALAWSQITPDDIVGKPFWLAAPMRDNPGLQAAVAAGISRAAAGETVREEHEMRGAGEVRAIVDFSVKPVLGETGEPTFLVAEGRDITALKEAQEALRQSQKMEAMGQLTGGVAHDFNNLLTPIVGSLDMLQRKGLGGERERRLIDGAMQSADRAKTLVQRLLAFARRQPLQTQAVDIRGLVEGMADLVASTSGPRVRVEIDVTDELPAAKADANQVEMAVLNLAVNARDAMPEGGTLTISAKPIIVVLGERPDLEAGRYVRLAVADTGTGMDEATARRAVEPFFSTKGIGRGTGLGLSMVHGLASQLGGGLSITSKPGLGTCVELFLPSSDEAVPPSDQVEGSKSGPGAGVAILVDDEQLVRESTADMLEDLGFAVVEAASGEEALRLIDGGQHFDLLISDDLMPGMTGTELAREIRSRRPEARVLVISGYADVGGVAPDLPRLIKPFKQVDLSSKLGELDGTHSVDPN